MLAAYKPKMASSPAGPMNPDRFERMWILAYVKEPKLADCTKGSQAKCIEDCIELGLVPGGVIPEVHLVPFGKDMTVIPDYRGLIKVLRGRGGVVKIEARTVRQGEVFEVHYGTDPRIIHDPKFDGGARPVIAFYAVAWLDDGTQQFDVLSKAEVDNVRANAAGGNSLMWKTYPDEGGKKTAVKRLCKMLTLEGIAAKVVTIDDLEEIPAEILDDGEVVGEQIDDMKGRLAKQTNGKKDEPAAQSAQEESSGQLPITRASSPALDNIMTMLDVVDKPKENGDIDVAKRTAFVREATGDDTAEPTESYFRTFQGKALVEKETQIREALEA